MDPNGIFAIFAIFIAAPTVVLSFIYVSKRSRHRIEELKYQKEILELEIVKEQTRLKSLAEENRKYDRLIDEGKKKE